MSFLGRARQLGRALAQQHVSGSTAREALQGSSTSSSMVASQAMQQQTRRFASGGGGHGEEVTYAGLTLHKAAPAHVWTGKLLCATMWFWVMYRAYHDGHTFLFGHADHWEHEIAHDAQHGSGHGHGDGHH